MHPLGHLLSTAAACAAAYAAGPPGLALGLALGGFFIDLDHYLDYLLVERQYSLDPRRFLRYYLDREFRRVVLPLHSYELMAALCLLAVLVGSPLLWGYLLGAALHLGLDIGFNGREALLHPVRFYSFWHRYRRGFDARALIHPSHLSAGGWSAWEVEVEDRPRQDATSEAGYRACDEVGATYRAQGEQRSHPWPSAAPEGR